MQIVKLSNPKLFNSKELNFIQQNNIKSFIIKYNRREILWYQNHKVFETDMSYNDLKIFKTNIRYDTSQIRRKL